ncbi:MAG: hypothetical protein PUA92_11125 [Clostridium sp.]|nr:hypothetical protein [Clostridium sp.]
MGTLKFSVMQESVSAVKALLNDSKMNFVMIGYHLRKIDDDKLYRESGHENIWDFAKAQFGLSKSSASRFMAINERFSVGGYSDRLAEEYKEFSVSQMSEMLTLTDEQIRSIDSDTTIRDIRKMKPKKKEQPKESVMAVATSQQMEIPDEIEGITSDDPEGVEILQQENDTTEDPEHYTIFDVKMHLAQEEENLRICREEDIRSKIRQRSAINVAAYKTLLSVMSESAEEVTELEASESVELQDLPTMKNNDQRGAFIDDYQSWPLWIETPETGERIFRFNISSDIAIAVRDQKQHLWIPGKYKYSTETEYTGERYYLLGISSNYGVKGAEFKKSQEKTFSESLINRSNLIEFLKKYQKGEVK